MKGFFQSHDNTEKLDPVIQEIEAVEKWSNELFDSNSVIKKMCEYTILGIFEKTKQMGTTFQVLKDFMEPLSKYESSDLSRNVDLIKAVLSSINDKNISARDSRIKTFESSDVESFYENVINNRPLYSVPGQSF